MGRVVSSTRLVCTVEDVSPSEMQHSDAPHREIQRAADALQRMGQAENLAELEEHWKDFLHRVDRAWNKALDHFGKSPKWGGWCGRYVKARKSDPLLSYLVNARNADEHSITDIVRHQRGWVAVGPADLGSYRVNSLTITDGRIQVDSPDPTRVTFSPERMHLLPVKNRGVDYPVPRSHQGKPIADPSAIAVAELGLVFYKTMLDAAETYFVAR